LHRSIKKSTWIYAHAKKEPKQSTFARKRTVRITKQDLFIAYTAVKIRCTTMRLLELPKRSLLFREISFPLDKISCGCMHKCRKSFKYTVL
jgi:hypothetical protein